MQLSLFLVSIFGAGYVSPTNPIVKALIGTPTSPGIVLIAFTVVKGAILLRCLDELYRWVSTANSDHGRNLLHLMAGGLAIQHAPEVFGLITGVTIPRLF